MTTTFKIDVDRTVETEEDTKRIDYLCHRIMDVVETENMTTVETVKVFSEFLKFIMQKDKKNGKRI